MVSDLLERLQAALADRYAIERELGRGGMAVVYLARDRKLGRPVALKVLRPELAASLGADRFLREIEIAAKLTHPNILPLYDCGQIGGPAEAGLEDAEERPTALPPYRPTAEFLYYTMPYVAGESLRARLNREKQLPIEDALVPSLGRQLPGGFGFLPGHQVGETKSRGDYSLGSSA